MSSVRSYFVGAAAVLFLAACGRTDDTTADTPMFDTVGQSTISGVPDDTAGARTVHVVLAEWRVSPSETTLAPGRVTFHVMNEGQNHHALEVERGNEEWKTDHIAPGGTATVTVDLTPGTYTLYCPMNDAQGDHRQQGMQTTITVR
jgi:plastocyanin